MGLPSFIQDLSKVYDLGKKKDIEVSPEKRKPLYPPQQLQSAHPGSVKPKVGNAEKHEVKPKQKSAKKNANIFSLDKKASADYVSWADLNFNSKINPSSIQEINRLIGEGDDEDRYYLKELNKK